MKAFVVTVLVVVLIVVLGAPSLVGAQIAGNPTGGSGQGLTNMPSGGQVLSGSSGAAALSAGAGGVRVQGSTLQGAGSQLGNAANTAAQGLRGTNVNANLNTNQNTTGINIGSISGTGGEAGGGGYSGSVEFASPYQESYIGFGSSTSYSVNFLQLPGFLGVPSNFSQPYKPEVWVNGPGSVVPSTLTRAQADECRASRISSSWDGGHRPAAESIELIWPSLGQKFPTLTTPTNYLGTSKVSATEKYSFMATVCQAAYEAMKNGATKGIVNFVIRAKNKTAGVGFGGSSGGSGLPAGLLATHPYALAGTLGFGTGIARAYVEGELLMHISGLRESSSAETPKGQRPQDAAAVNGAPLVGASNPYGFILPQTAEKPRDDAERSRPPAADKAWYGRTSTMGSQP